jgi:hypothetical protein
MEQGIFPSTAIQGCDTDLGHLWLATTLRLFKHYKMSTNPVIKDFSSNVDTYPDIQGSLTFCFYGT